MLGVLPQVQLVIYLRKRVRLMVVQASGSRQAQWLRRGCTLGRALMTSRCSLTFSMHVLVAVGVAILHVAWVV
eukprot:8842198-Pyramimonas_sp.AAC.1